LITRTQALLWTDGRYFNQASKELSSDWTLMRSGVPGVPTLTQWLVQNIPKGKTIGVDASLISASAAHELIDSGVSLVAIGKLILDPSSSDHHLKRKILWIVFGVLIVQHRR
jgi:Xaa-Pro aminopeptidase